MIVLYDSSANRSILNNIVSIMAYWVRAWNFITHGHAMRDDVGGSNPGPWHYSRGEFFIQSGNWQGFRCRIGQLV